jgi:hypothetical protein
MRLDPVGFAPGLSSQGPNLSNKRHQPHYRDPGLPILLGEQVLIACLRIGLEQGLFVYKEGDL